MNVGGVVLCGGRSTRMGLPKATLPFGDESMLARVVRLLSEVVGPIVVVAAPGQAPPPTGVEIEIAHDRREARGPLEGLAAGLRAIGNRVDAVYATSCDVPLLAPAFVRRMIELLGTHDIAVPVDGEFPHPLAAVYRTAVLLRIESLLAADRLRPVYLFDQCDTARVPVESLREADPLLSTLANLNRPQDYFQALSQAGFKPDPAIAQQLAAGE
jgi:molybdopterin-guanine dinucleotide biosynthesis protein A